MRIPLLLLALAAIVAFCAVAALPARAVAGPQLVEWQRLYGGSGTEKAAAVQQTDDGGYLLFGETLSSASGDVAGRNHGSRDLWLANLDAGGAIRWQRLYGGSGMEEARALARTADGGVVVLACSESSASGDVEGVSHGGFDYWVVKLDGAGQIQWQRLLGGIGTECGSTVLPTADGGYLVTGRSSSSRSGDVEGANHGDYDLWVVKLSATGIVEWQRLLGGGGTEQRRAPVLQLDDGGYLLLGSTASRASGDVAGTNHGGYDLWVVRLDGAGGVLWQRLLGGSGDETGIALERGADGGFLVLADAASGSSGDVAGPNHGGSDLWVVDLGPAGEVRDQHLYGGSADEHGAAVRRGADGGLLVLGDSASSASGDVAGTGHGGTDLWVVELDATGAVRDQRLWGGGGTETAAAIGAAADGGSALAGDTTSSASGDVAGATHGGRDLWLVRLDGATPRVAAVPGGVGPPTDENGDGLDEDVNGNERDDFADVVLDFAEMAWLAGNEPVTFFDFNGNGRVDFADVVWLFNHL